MRSPISDFTCGLPLQHPFRQLYLFRYFEETRELNIDQQIRRMMNLFFDHKPTLLRVKADYRTISNWIEEAPDNPNLTGYLIKFCKMTVYYLSRFAPGFDCTYVPDQFEFSMNFQANELQAPYQNVRKIAAFNHNITLYTLNNNNNYQVYRNLTTSQRLPITIIQELKFGDDYLVWLDLIAARKRLILETLAENYYVRQVSALPTAEHISLEIRAARAVYIDRIHDLTPIRFIMAMMFFVHSADEQENKAELVRTFKHLFPGANYAQYEEEAIAFEPVFDLVQIICSVPPPR